uniref:Ras GTPase-activating protein 4-like n=1 Tax=Taeniopygia guttata TaxID=59729 RepID=A0A674H944_TAEGU
MMKPSSGLPRCGRRCPRSGGRNTRCSSSLVSTASPSTSWTRMPSGYSGWMSLSEVDPDEEVQGEIHLRVEVLGSQGSRRLRCSVLEARDLARKDRNGASDPFVRLRYNGKTQESTVVKKSCYPRWNETFEFELAEPAEEKLCVEVWDWDLVGRNDFLGKVVFSVQGLEAAGQEEGWFRLCPDKSKPTEDERRGSLGSLQLQVKLRDETVLPSHCYQPLVQLLCQEVKLGRQDGQVHLVTLLDETTTAECRQEVAINLVKLFLGQGLVKEFLDLLFELELAKPCEPNTLFRSNSLASKSMESFLKVTGMPYLHFVLGPTITRVFEEKKYVELDPGKVEIKDVGCSGLHRVQTEGEVIEQGRQHLQSYLGELLDAIVRSAPACPPLIRAAFRQLFQRVGERFPQHQHAKFVAVTSFLCLRFFSPAVMTPKLFQLRAAHADARTGRTLLLLAKAIQLVGNMEPAAGRAKETWLSPLLPALQEGTARMRDFITRLVGTEEEKGEEEGEGRPLGPPPAVVKEGMLLVHKTRGKGPLLAAAAGKKLNFCLTGESLSFGKSPGAERIGAIALGDILAAEKVEEKSFGSSHVMQVVYMGTGGQQETAYLQCKVRWHSAGGGTGRAVAQRGVPLTVPNPAVCQRAEPVAVSPAQSVRQQPPRAPLLPPRRLPRRQVELLPPARQDRYGEVAPEPRGGAGVFPRYGDRAAPQGWDATGPGTASPCRTGVTRWTPRWRLSGSSSTCRACGGRSGESCPRDPRTAPQPRCSATAALCPLRRDKYWELLELLEPGAARNGEGGLGCGVWGCSAWEVTPGSCGCHCPALSRRRCPARGAEPAAGGAGGAGALPPPGAAPAAGPGPAAAADVREK